MMAFFKKIVCMQKLFKAKSIGDSNREKVHDVFSRTIFPIFCNTIFFVA